MIPILQTAMDKVSRELIGAIPASTYDMQASQGAKDQEIVFPVTPASQNSDLTAGASVPNATGEVIDNVKLTISKVRKATPIVWTGEEQLSVNGVINNIIADQYTQRMRSLVNEIEADICAEAVRGAMLKGNFVGSVGTALFANNIGDLAEVLKKMKDNGAPTEDLQFVMNTATGMNMRKLTQLTNVNQAGNDSLLRRGVLTDLFGFAVRESGGFRQTDCTATGYLINGTNPIGATTINVDTGTGAIPKGTMITIAGDTTQYVVVEDVANGGTSIKLHTGLVKSPADNAAITVASYMPNVAFSKSAVVLATRLPAMPAGGDSALDVTTITDPVSGLSFLVTLYGGYHQNTVEISCAWGVKNIKPEHSVALIG